MGYKTRKIRGVTCLYRNHGLIYHILRKNHILWLFSESRFEKRKNHKLWKNLTKTAPGMFSKLLYHDFQVFQGYNRVISDCRTVRPKRRSLFRSDSGLGISRALRKSVFETKKGGTYHFFHGKWSPEGRKFGHFGDSWTEKVALL